MEKGQGNYILLEYFPQKNSFIYLLALKQSKLLYILNIWHCAVCKPYNTFFLKQFAWAKLKAKYSLLSMFVTQGTMLK